MAAMKAMALAALAGVAVSADAMAINVSVRRSRSGLASTAMVPKSGGGMVTIGLRGASPTNNVTQQAWVGVWETDSDDRRGDANGFTPDHPFMRDFFGDGVRDFAVDGSAAPVNNTAGNTTDRHAMGVAGIILSKHGTNRGMAHRAQGVVALHDDVGRLFYGQGGRFPSLTAAADWTQYKASGDFLNGYPANVINSSTGYSVKPNPNFGQPNQAATVPVVQGDLTGNSYMSRVVDSYAFTSDRVMVVAAGNAGTSNNGLLSYPGDNYNGISVGALVAVTANSGTVQVASYSSFQPLANNRNGVDIVAPGSSITSTNAHHQGPAANYINIGNGTSFATPHVTGAAAILWSAGKQGVANDARTDKADAFSHDHKLIKSLLLNGADKVPGSRVGGPNPANWTPGRVDPGDATKWLNPLNYVVGAGELNTAESWKTMREESFQSVGDMQKHRYWDEDTVTQATSSIGYQTDLFPDFQLDEGHWITDLTATLTWDRHVTNPANAAPGISDLNLHFEYSLNEGATWTRLLASVSTVDNTEHVHLTGLDKQGDDAIYRLLVENAGLAAGVAGEAYAMAVSYRTIPAPGGAALIGLAGLLAAARRR